jgi:hypothetical protein
MVETTFMFFLTKVFMLTDFGNIINCDTFSVAPSVFNDNLNKHAAPLFHYKKSYLMKKKL